MAKVGQAIEEVRLVVWKKKKPSSWFPDGNQTRKAQASRDW